ncbi:uncharacterized protein LOC118188705 [Stegodyphus dumicola]|uniref:uncharacterized protein LOC118188705 n=1 Tax=Stegodyphus dumicola TaxID=202533 RepID=UPI0015AEE347|nr:uncharacterized protein LOC118188705 [Stegodyphus dumicola]
MRRQRYSYTLTTRDDMVVPPDPDESSILSNQYSFQDPFLSQILSPEPDSVVPYYLYPYPLFPVPADQYQSVASLYNSNLSLSPYDNYAYFNGGFPQYDYVSSTRIFDGGYGDQLTPKDEYVDEEFVYDGLEDFPQELPSSHPIVTNYGAVTILLRHLVRIDISADKALYVTNPPSGSIAAFNGTTDKSCIIHPNGRVLQEGSDIHISTLNRQAKVCRKGIIFTSSDHCLSYLVDASGTKTTAEKFRDLSTDFSVEVFYSDLLSHNPIDECYKIATESLHKCYKNGDEVWIVGGFRIKQDQWGDVKVSHNYGRLVLKASPTNGQMSIKTPSVEMRVSRYPNNYLLVRRYEQEVTASLRGFIAQNGTQKAGFNSYGRVVLF